MSVLSLSDQLTNTTQVTTNHTQYTHPDAQVAAFDSSNLGSFALGCPGNLKMNNLTLQVCSLCKVLLAGVERDVESDE